jgi:hypothetical protein
MRTQCSAVQTVQCAEYEWLVFQSTHIPARAYIVMLFQLLPFVPGPPWTLSCWHNGMFAPLTVGPTDVKFALWDQGENDVGTTNWYVRARERRQIQSEVPMR